MIFGFLTWLAYVFQTMAMSKGFIQHDEKEDNDEADGKLYLACTQKNTEKWKGNIEK